MKFESRVVRVKPFNQLFFNYTFVLGDKQVTRNRAQAGINGFFGGVLYTPPQR